MTDVRRDLLIRVRIDPETGERWLCADELLWALTELVQQLPADELLGAMHLVDRLACAVQP